MGHQYSPAGLSFAGLKGEDAALAKVLRAAAERAGCAVHLGIVHIEEYGPVQPNYDRGYGYGRQRRWRICYEEEIEQNASNDSFEVIEDSDGSRHIDQWVNTQDQAVAYGQLPLEEGEVLPSDALDDEAPDERRLMEATGNEGASFECSYHRAALVIWTHERFAWVSLQAGVGAALPHLDKRLAAGDKAAADIARQIIEAWEQPSDWSYHRRLAKEPSRAEMLRWLTKLGDRALLKRFVAGVVAREFDGSENEALEKALALLGPKQAGKLLAAIVRENFPLFHCACVTLAGCVLRVLGEQLNCEWRLVLREAAAAIVLRMERLVQTLRAFAADAQAPRESTWHLLRQM